jgi:acyl-CoA synthetase (AMP-forming)/AMP-acid ligase II
MRETSLSRLVNCRASQNQAAPIYMEARTGKVTTWVDVAAQAEHWRHNWSPGTTVGIVLASPVAFCRAYLAGIAAGACVVPIDPSATAAELVTTLDTLEVADVVVDEETDVTFADHAVSTWEISESGLRRSNVGATRSTLATGYAVLMATSGTTGRPKIVPLKEDHLLRVATLIAEHLELGSADRCFSPLPLFHINAQVVGVLSTLVADSSLIVDDRFHRSDFWAIADELGATWLNLVPAVLEILNHEPVPTDATLATLRFARSASSTLPISVLETFKSRFGIGVIETYGMTEAASQIAANPLDEARRRPGSVGQLIGLEGRIVDEGGKGLGPEAIGAVELRGRNVIDAYLGAHRVPRSALTDDGWLPTGDLGRFDEDGFLYLAGRSDEVINRSGEKVYPGEIEEVLLRNPQVLAAAVVGRPNATLGAEPVAFFTVVDPSRKDELVAELQAQCVTALSRYKRPVEILVVDELPVGKSGKTAPNVLRASLSGVVRRRA